MAVFILMMSSLVFASEKATVNASEAMKYAVLAGRKSYLSGRIKKNTFGNASSPKQGLI